MSADSDNPVFLLVLKQHKILAFPPIEANFPPTVCGASLEGQAILNKNVNGDEPTSVFRWSLTPRCALVLKLGGSLST
ncbi:hypothetical protein GGR53DRAFT_462945 [Hypoxylon sp. FL1150]|nr:hypothetical protein GGR53DRAFT_462945 [Hypoxylon sp. FL1150]